MFHLLRLGFGFAATPFPRSFPALPVTAAPPLLSARSSLNGVPPPRDKLMEREECWQGDHLENRFSRRRRGWRGIALHGPDELTNPQAKIFVNHISEKFGRSRATEALDVFQHVCPKGYARLDEERVQLVCPRKAGGLHCHFKPKPGIDPIQ